MNRALQFNKYRHWRLPNGNEWSIRRFINVETERRNSVSGNYSVSERPSNILHFEIDFINGVESLSVTCIVIIIF